MSAAAHTADDGADLAAARRAALEIAELLNQIASRRLATAVDDVARQFAERELREQIERERGESVCALALAAREGNR